jgi:hypothetical protein
MLNPGMRLARNEITALFSGRGGMGFQGEC